MSKKKKTTLFPVPNPSRNFYLVPRLGSFSNDDGDGNENGENARAARILSFVHFCAVTAQLRRENAEFHVLWRK